MPALSLTLIALLAGSAAPTSVPAWSPGSIVWSETRPGGTQRTFLDGDPASAGGLVTYAFHIPAGTWFPPHVHPTSARVFVIKGALLLGVGGVADRTHVQRIGVGGMALVAADLPHYEGAEEDTVIIGVAPGPFGTHFLPSH